MALLDWGFDLTDFGSAKKFQKIIDKYDLEYQRLIIDEGKSTERYAYRFYRLEPFLEIITGNNPITGEFSLPMYREKQKGYASYVGITGEEKLVKSVIKDIKKLAIDIKDESPGIRYFI